MQLKSFPFDGQMLTIDLSFDACDTVVEVDEELSRANLIETATMLVDDEYYVGRPFFEPVLYQSANLGTMSGKSYWHIQFSIPVFRKTSYYELKAFMPIFTVVAFSWTVFALPKEKYPAERLLLLVGCFLLLTLVELKFSMTSRLPKLSYLTMVDWYILGGYVALALTVLGCVIEYANVCGSLENDGSLVAYSKLYLCIPLEEGRFGRLMIVLYVWHFFRPLFLAKYWQERWRRPYNGRRSYDNGGERELLNQPVTRTWIQVIMKLFESPCIACLFWSKGPFKHSWNAVPICALSTIQLVRLLLHVLAMRSRRDDYD